MTLLIVSFLCVSRASGADPAAVVPVTVAADLAEAESLFAVLRDVIGELEVDLQLQRVDEIDHSVVLTPVLDDDSPLARVWIDVQDPQRAVLYLADGPWERVLVRFVRRASDDAELLREQLALILRSALQGLLNGGRIGVTTAEARRLIDPERRRANDPLPAPKAPAPRAPTVSRPSAAPPQEWRTSAGLFYSAQSFGDTVRLSHGPGLMAQAAAVAGAFRPGALLTLEYRFAELDDPAVPFAAELDTLSARASVAVGYESSFILQAALGGGLDFVRFSPLAKTANIRAEPAQVLRYGAFRLSTILAYPATRGVWVFLMVAPEWYPRPATYRYQLNDGRLVSGLETASLRWSFALGVHLDL